MSLFTLESSGQGSVDEITSDTVCDKHYFVLINPETEGENCGVEEPSFFLGSLIPGSEQLNWNPESLILAVRVPWDPDSHQHH